MFVVSAADFFENPALYKEKAENYGIKILPRKKEKKLSHKIQNKIDALNAVIGILPSDVDENSAKAERLKRQWEFCLIPILQLIFLQTVMNFIDTMKIAKITAKDLKFAFTGVMSDFEDALQANCAKRYHIDYIITRNVKDFKLSPVKAIEPSEFFKVYPRVRHWKGADARA